MSKGVKKVSFFRNFLIYKMAEMYNIMEKAGKLFPEQLPRLEKALRSIVSIAYFPDKLKLFAENMIYLSKNSTYTGTNPSYLEMYKLLESLQNEGILPSNTISSVNQLFISMCTRFKITTAAQTAALTLGLQLAAVAAVMVVGTIGLVHLAPDEFCDPEDNALLPLDISDEELERNRQNRIEDRIKNNIPFCAYNQGLDKCLPTANRNHDERHCYVKEGQCKVNEGWITSAYNWWNGNDTDIPLFYKNQDGSLAPLTAETFHNQALYKKDGSLFKEAWVCPICLEDTVSDVSWLNSGMKDAHGHDVCGHKYHTACIDKMMEDNKREGRPSLCPLCRTKINLTHFTKRPNPHHEGRKKSKNRLLKKRAFRKSR